MAHEHVSHDAYKNMKVGPRYKVCKRLGNGVYEKCQTQKYTLSESRRKQGPGQRRPRQLSDYGKQLLEKQRVRYTYGITEKQLTRYVNEATAKTGDATETLLSTLERRLDNVVYRLGLAPTRRAARQMVVHGHVRVNGKKAGIPSHIVKENDKITVKETSKKLALFENLTDRLAEHKAPNWLTFNAKSMEGMLKGVPNKENTETMFDLGVVMEYYSR